jgi:hypothetical protein
VVTPAGGYTAPVVGNTPAAGGYPQPGTSNTQSATGYTQPAAGYTQPATGYTQPATGYTQPAATSNRPGSYGNTGSTYTPSPYGNTGSANTPSPYGSGGYGAPAPAAPTVAPQKASEGPCRVQPSPERQTLSLVSGTEGLARDQVALGEYRAQLVVHSPDARWAVAFTKLRGANQFAVITVDLTRCKVERTVELPGAGTDAEFQGSEVLLRFAGGERRVGLQNGGVR